MDMLNVASTGMFTILALIVNLKWCACKKWTWSLKLVVILVQCRYTKNAQRIFMQSDIQFTSLTLDKILNSLIYRTLFYVNIYGSYKLLKTVQFLAHSVYWDCWRLGNWKLARDKTKLSWLVANSVHTTDTDKTRQSCLVRVCGVNMLLVTVNVALCSFCWW